MSNQVRRKQVKDLARKRRDYVLRTFIMEMVGMLCALATALFGFAGLTLIVVACFVWPRILGGNFLFSMALAAGLGSMSGLGLMLANWAERQSDALTPVPPVHEQLADIPAEEVLLRGSEQPAATPEELLRAAHESSEQPAEDLLRGLGPSEQ